MTDKELEELKELAELAYYAESFAIPVAKEKEFKHIDWKQVLDTKPEEADTGA